MQQATAEDKWLSVTLEANDLVPSYKQKSLEDLFQSTILVLVGMDNGQFGVLDVEKGSLTHVVRSHSGPIHTITCFEDSNHVVTTANGECYTPTRTHTRVCANNNIICVPRVQIVRYLCGRYTLMPQKMLCLK